MIRFENVGKRYGTGPEILRDISFELAPGSFHFLTGPSGAGKTSLLNLLCLAQKPSRGKITLFNRDMATVGRHELPGLRRRVGMVFQDCRLLEHMSVMDNVALPLRIAGVHHTRIRDYVEELLTWVGLGAHMQARPSTLSGGEQQRAAIARAVIARPRLLLADEPTGNVDDKIGLRLMRLFEEMHRDGTTVMVATHNRQLVNRFDHPCLYLSGGSLGPAEKI